MTYPRAHLIDQVNPGFYHLISRCVRRAWLCGEDPASGRSFEHRRGWIEQRIAYLAEHFAVEIYAYAVMSNHYHLVLRAEPLAPQQWSDETVAARWAALGPGSEEGRSARAQAIVGDPQRLAQCRERLGSVSWLMRYLNEPLARRANCEDRCKGRFWEGRFVSRALLDERAVLACMAYVDMNPVRAGIAERAGEAEFTSLRRRRHTARSQAPLAPVFSGVPGRIDALELTEGAYRCLVEWTGGALYPTGDPAPGAPPDLPGFAAQPDEWMREVTAHRLVHRRAFGALAALRALAERLGQRWVKGVGTPRPPLLHPG